MSPCFFFGNKMLYPTLIYKAFYKFSHLNIHLSLFLGGHHLCVSVCPCGHLSVPKIVCVLRSPRRLGHCRAPQSSAWFRVFYCAILVFLWLCCKVISCCFLSSTWWLSISQSKNEKCKWEPELQKDYPCPVSWFSTKKCPNHVFCEFGHNMRHKSTHRLAFCSFMVTWSWIVSKIFTTLSCLGQICLD